MANESLMPRGGLRSALTLAVAATCLAWVGCDSKPSGVEPAGTTVSNLKGIVEVAGSSTVAPINNAIYEQFKQEFPEVTANIAAKGTGIGFSRFAAREADITGASRPIKPGEWSEAKAAGVDFLELPIAYDGLTFVVHPENDWVKELTVDQLKRIFASDDPAKTWKDVDPSWPDAELKVFSPGTGSGTYDYVREVLAGKGELRGDMSLNEDDNLLVRGVAGNKYSISFFGVAYFEANKEKLRAVPIVNPADGKAYMATEQTIAANEYSPFSRPLFIYVNAASLDRAEVQTFVDFYLGHADDTASQVGYVRLPEAILQKSREAFDNVQTGTHFVTEAGESREGGFSELFVDGNRVP